MTRATKNPHPAPEPIFKTIGYNASTLISAQAGDGGSCFDKKF